MCLFYITMKRPNPFIYFSSYLDFCLKNPPIPLTHSLDWPLTMSLILHLAISGNYISLLYLTNKLANWGSVMGLRRRREEAVSSLAVITNFRRARALFPARTKSGRSKTLLRYTSRPCHVRTYVRTLATRPQNTTLTIESRTMYVRTCALKRALFLRQYCVPIWLNNCVRRTHIFCPHEIFWLQDGDRHLLPGESN